MSAITDANFTYSVVSTVGRTLAITGINPSNATYSASNTNWGAFPAIPAVYAGSNTAYNGNGVPANAFKVAEIGANAFDSLAEYNAFAATTLTAAFLPANLKRIGDRAFANVKLSGTLTIPATLDSVGFQAFHGTLVTDIVIGSSTNSTIVAHLANLTSVIQQEINDRAAADASLNALKAPIDNPAFTGIASIPTANIGLATVSSASIATAAISVANLTSAHLSAMNVVGNASFTGNVSVTGAWNFTVKPKINGEAVATESFVNDQIATIAGTGLATTLDTLTELASAIGGDSSFATNLINSHASISTTLSNEIVTRSNAALALSGALSTSASSLTVVDSALSTALSGEVSARSASVAGLSTALSTATSSLQVNNSAFSTALSTELSARSSEFTAASITRSTSESSLQLIDAGLSGVLSTEVSARGSAVASLVPVIAASRASLSTVDDNANAALSAETSTRVSAVASLNLLQTTAFASLSGITSSLSTALSTEASARTAAGSSLSASASVAAVSLQQTNTQFSIALAAEVGARGTSVPSLATSISASVSALVSANSAAATALGAETAVRAGVVPSVAASVTNAVASVSASVLAHSNAMIAETSVRTSQIQSISTAASTAVASLSNANSGISSALIVEGATRSTAVSTAIQNILSGAPTRFNTLEKIASEMITNPVITINDSTISRVSALRTAVSSETSARVSAVASLSNTAIPSLSVVDAGLINALSTETSARGSAVASLSGALSAASVSFAAVNGVLSGALSSESAVRASAVGSVSTAVASVAAVLGAADASLSTAISSETVTRVSAITSISTAALQSFAWLNVAHSATSTAVATETSTRDASIASVSGAIAASFASLQTANGALSGSVSALSAALAPKATTAYLDGKIATLLNGAPAQLNTLAEMAAALGNNPNFASSISTALSAKGNAADASTVSLAIASKGGLAQLTSLATVVSNKADAAAMTTAINSVISLNNAVNALSTTVSTLQTTGGSVNGTTVAVSGVDIPTLAARIQEFYFKMGTENPSWGIINANGTINYKVNRLADPSLVSNVLLFEYGGNGAVNKVIHAITVQFDAAQTSATVTGGVGTPTTTVNNLVLDANRRHTFRIDYAGDLNYFQTNKTAASIVALDTKYKLAPSAPTVTAPALLLPFLSLDANTITIKYTGNAADVPTSEPLFIYANPRGTGPEWFAVVKQSTTMKTAISNYASGTSAPFIPSVFGQTEPVPFNNIVTTLMTDMSSIFANKTSFNSPIASWDTSNVTTMTSAFFNATAFNQPIGAWNTSSVTIMNDMFRDTNAFNQNISGWNVINVSPKPPVNFSTGSQLTAQTSPFGVAFTAPIISNSGIITYSGTTASMTYTVATGVTQVQVRKASDNTVIAATTSVSGTSASVSVTLTENTSIVVVALGNAAGRESAASAPQTLINQFAAPTKASGPVYTTVSAGSYTASMTYTVAAGVSAVQVRKASDNTPISGATSSISSLTATITVPFTNTISMVVVALTNNDIGRESLPSVAQTLVGQYAAPTLSGSVTYSDNTASMTYSVNSGVTAVTVLKSDLTALPTNVLVHTIINAGTSGRTVSLSVAFATSMSIVVIAQGNATGNQSAASAPLALLANFIKPTLSLSGITYSGNTAIMTYNVAEGVNAVSVLQPNLSALPSDATVTNNALSGTTATLHISLSGSRGWLSFVVVALTNANGRQIASDTQFISTGISDLTFTKNQSSNLWYFGFNCSNPSSVSGLNIHMTWTFSPGNGATGVTNNYSSATIANGANSLLISDPNNWLNVFLTGKTVNVSINYVVSGVSKNIATSFIPNPLTGGPYTMSVSDVNANAQTCTLVIPAALDQPRVAQNRTWIYVHRFIDATTNLTVGIPDPNGLYYISGSLQSINNVQLPSSLWGKPLRNSLEVVNLGTNNTGDYVVQQRFTSNDTYTLPNPAALFPVETNEIITYGMSWQTTGGINDVRMWRVSWTIRPTALDVASPNYVSKVGIRIKRGGESTYRFTGVYNYADGAGYAMLHTNVYTNQGQNVGTWITEIRAENADGTITNNYVARSDYYGANYASWGNYVNLTQLASAANDGYTLLYGDNVTNLF